MAADLPSDRLVPFRWPSSWTHPKLVELLKGGPVNCILFDSVQPADPVMAAVRKAGFSVRGWEALGAAAVSDVRSDSASPIISITDLVWPHMKRLTRRAARVLLVLPAIVGACATSDEGRQAAATACRSAAAVARLDHVPVVVPPADAHGV